MEGAHLDIVAAASPKWLRPLGILILCIVAVAGLSLALVARGSRSSKADVLPVQAYLRDLTTCCEVQDLKDYFGDRPAATSAVLTMLRRPEDEAHWYKAVVALGILAPSDEDLIASLLNFVASDSSFEICYSAATCSSATCLQELSFPAAKRPVAAGAAPAAISDGLAEAKIQAPIAIGDLLPRLAGWRSIEPVKILIAGTNPDYWPTRIRWASSPHFADDRERNVMIASQCVKALALSGQPIGQDRVRFLKANPSVQDAVFREAVDESSSLLTRRR